jgi:hypothetical protein
LWSDGYYQLGRPVRLKNNVTPNAGFNSWLPVANFQGKWLLMQCYATNFIGDII